MFRSLSYIITGSQAQHERLRTKIIQHMHDIAKIAVLRLPFDILLDKLGSAIVVLLLVLIHSRLYMMMLYNNWHNCQVYFVMCNK